MRIAISTKLFFITLFLLLAATLPIAFETSEYFEKTSREREENINLDLAGAKATEAEWILVSTLEKAKTYATNILKSVGSSEARGETEAVGFIQDKSFLAIEVYKVNGIKSTSLKKIVKAEYIKNVLKADPSAVQSGSAFSDFPLESVAKGTIEIKNESVPGGPSMFVIGFPLVKDGQGLITHLALVSVDLGVVEKPFNEVQERAFFMLDRQGNVLAHSIESHAIGREDFSKIPAFSIARESKTPRGQRLLDKSYVAYAKTSFGGATVYASISEDVVLEPAKEVGRRVFFIAAIVMSISLFLIYLFSTTLTAPIEKLVSLTDSIANGNFDVRAGDQVRSWSKDEVTDLAGAFDEMTTGLKERDKVKTLFSKFHGSSVTNDLLKGENKLGGQRKDILVFFSDIRGFTSFSENRSPEEVVEMLNEYFAVMVNIINSHGGVVDKFIGDAIMAVWGAPISQTADTFNAMTACLAMRKGLADLNTLRISRGQPPILIGMGLHAGPAISGTIGSDERMEYTVIGNTVNTASRIEAATKSFGSDLLVSEEVHERIKSSFASEYAGEVAVKGRSEQLKMYKVRGRILPSGEIEDLTTIYSDYKSESSEKVSVAGQTKKTSAA